MPKVSIVVPIYNVEKYLPECLDSLVAQTLQDIEIICVNDGSTDGSLKIVQQYAAKDPRITVIDKKNAGYGHTCNVGIEATTAPYVGIIESDDFADPHMFAELYEMIIEQDCVLAKSDWYEYTPTHNKIVKGAYIISRVNPGRISSVADKKNLLKSPAAIWSCLYQKSFLEEHHIRFLETPGASFQDVSFRFKTIVLAPSIYITRNAYVYYRQDNPHSSILRPDGGEFILKEYAEIDDFLAHHPNLKEVYNGIKIYIQYKDFLWNLKRIAPKYRQDFSARFAQEFKTYYDNGELDDSAIGYFDRTRIMKLVHTPEKALKSFQRQFIARRIKNLRRKLISIRINSKRASIELFGRQILRIER
ncbi:MAG: glycosyltransferase [Holosporales bacterium]|jgi:glycosyltransferase involved in cell wall biosynthesis|nr:glycosyltransferase [Holosporales bacterium]